MINTHKLAVASISSHKKITINEASILRVNPVCIEEIEKKSLLGCISYHKRFCMIH